MGTCFSPRVPEACLTSWGRRSLGIPHLWGLPRPSLSHWSPPGDHGSMSLPSTQALWGACFPPRVPGGPKASQFGAISSQGRGLSLKRVWEGMLPPSPNSPMGVSALQHFGMRLGI